MWWRCQRYHGTNHRTAEAEADDDVAVAGMSIVPYATFYVASSSVGGTVCTTVRTSGRPEDAYAQRRRPPNDDDAPAPFKGGNDGALTLTLASNSSEGFSGCGVVPVFLGTSTGTGRKDHQQEGRGRGG